MSVRSRNFMRATLAAFVILALHAAVSAQAQSSGNERSFPQSKAAVEKALKILQAGLSGHLPVLDGFAKPGEHSLDHYARGFFQTTVQVRSTPSGGSIVQVTTKVTAWYSDPSGAHSGYQLLTSNGRLESDLLDQLSDQLGSAPAANETAPPPTAAPKPSTSMPASAEAAVTPPASPGKDSIFAKSLNQTLTAEERAAVRPSFPSGMEKTDSALQTEAANLEEILKNQAHPKNLVAVKKSGTPVVAAPSLTAKTEFLASAHDEFEMLTFNADWVHVRISGLSRGWIWRNSVEMPEGIANTDASAASALTPAADLFHVTRQETAAFPGDWEPLRGKNVQIISVQNIDGSSKEAGPKDRLEYAKFLLDKNYTEMLKNPQGLAGIVVIFDSADGGMIAATLPALQQWKSGTISDSALWHKCFFDPPETFDSAPPAGTQ